MLSLVLENWLSSQEHVLLTENLNSVPNSYDEGLPSYKKTNTLFWPLQAPICRYTYTQVVIHTAINK